MPFQKEDLVNQYEWGTTDPSIFTGTPSRRVFNRVDGNQVLFLINYYGSMSEKFSLDNSRQLEELILRELPLEAKSEISVVNWLKERL